MPKKPDYPKIIKSGSVSVRVYRVKHKTTSDGWAYTLAWTAGGRRRLQQFASEADATEEGRVKVAQLAGGRVEGADMTRSDRDDLQAARDICGPVPFLAALEEWRRARELTQGQLIPASESWAARNVSKFSRIKVDAAIDAFIAAKERAGKQGERTYLSKLKPLKEYFKDRFLDTIGAAEFTAYLERYEDGVTRNDFRKRTVALCRWAQRIGHLPKHITLEIEETERAVENKTQIGIITPTTYGRLLRFFRENHSEHLAALVLAGFCGIRSDEIHGKRADRSKRQVWEDIHLERRFVQVTTAKTNTPAWRIVPICESAVAWLKLCPSRKGPVCEAGAMERVRSLAIGAGFALPENCFRHSFISYRIAVTANKPQVATEAGNSVGEIDRRYRVPLPKDQGEEWFAMNPYKAGELPAV
jgi:hypothetical protein